MRDDIPHGSVVVLSSSWFTTRYAYGDSTTANTLIVLIELTSLWLVYELSPQLHSSSIWSWSLDVIIWSWSWYAAGFCLVMRDDPHHGSVVVLSSSWFTTRYAYRDSTTAIRNRCEGIFALLQLEEECTVGCISTLYSYYQSKHQIELVTTSQ